MEKFPLTQSGLQQLLAQLYQLPDSELSAEAASAAADFRKWLGEKFDLEPSQLLYLSAVSDEFIADASQQTRYFLLGRKPIELSKQEKPAARTADEPADKIVVVNGDKKSSYSPAEGYSEQEVLNFLILYPQAS